MEQDSAGFDLFFTILQDTTFPVQPRTWDIPGQGDLENPLSGDLYIYKIQAGEYSKTMKMVLLK